MPRIYTSYFANIRKMPDNIVPISVAKYPPSWYAGLRLPSLAPLNDIILSAKVQKDYDYASSKYRKLILAEHDPAAVYAQILRMTEGKDAALLCFEKPGDFCHRHILAEWLSTVAAVDEWEPEEDKPTEEQIKLF